MLQLDQAVLLVIDVQGKLAELMHQKDSLFANLQKIIRGAQTLDLPIVVTEQVPEKLGPTRPELANLLETNTCVIAKKSFSCCGNNEFMEKLSALQRSQILVTGIETHICVYQTAVELVDRGYEVQLVTDAVSSRTAENRALAIERIDQSGATLTSTEMALFELLKVAEGDTFRQVSRIVK